MRQLIGALAGLAFAFGAHAAFATQLMPDYAGVPTGWVTDRYEPNSFSNVGSFQGRNDVLGIGITSAEGLNNRPAAYQSTFYNTQGRQYDISGGVNDWVSADLYIPSNWNSLSTAFLAPTVRSDMWGVMSDGSAVSSYPIIGFTNYAGAPRYRIWDADAGGWVDLATPVVYDDWTSFEILFDGSAFVFSIDGTIVYTDSTINGSVQFDALIMQAYNFFGDASLGQVNAQDYVAHWSNAQVQVPEPGAFGVFAAGLLFAGWQVGRRRRLRVKPA